MNIKKLLLTLIFLSCLFRSNFQGQQQSYFSFELAGSGGLASFNYEHLVLDKPILDLHIRYGFSLIPIDKNNGVNLIFPIMLHSIIGKTDHKLDLAIGQAISFTTKGSFFISAPLALGYRYQPLEKKYFLRISYTPLLSYLIDIQLQNWAGITFGYNFKQ